jgi:Do/DeqQ family serine protease
MKQVILIGTVALSSSLGTAFFYKFFLEERYPVREVVVREPSNAVQVTNRHNQSPFGIPHTQMANAFTDAANLARPCVVHIRSGGGGDDIFSLEGVSSGSGVILSEDGYIITNNHVVEGSKELKVTLNDRRTYAAKIIGTDPTTDLALIKIKDKELDGKKLPSLSFANSDEVVVGQWVLAVGNPFNLASTVTAGIVSAKGRNIDILKGANSIESFIQTDAAVNPGNSGGALINPSGQLVGINTAIMTRSGRYEGYSFAIPANLVKKIFNDLLEFGEVKRGFLGVRARDLTMEQMKKYKLENLDGGYLAEVNSNSAASEAGLKTGDIITKINGVKIATSPELQERVAMFRPNTKIVVEYIREGKTYEVDVTLKGSVPDEALDRAREKKRSEKYQNKATVLEEVGLTVRPMTKTEEEKMGRKGVWVTTIKKGSPVYGTNMERNFLITSINGKAIGSVEDLEAAIFEAEDEVAIQGYYEKISRMFTYSFDKY